MRRFFRASSAIVLIFTALAKLVAVGISKKLLSYGNPVFGVPEVAVLALAAVIELAVAGVLLSSRWTGCQKSLLLFWLCVVFLAYRGFANFTPFPSLCPCLGHLEWMGVLPDSYTSKVSSYLLLYMLVGALVCSLIDAKVLERLVKA
jgi:hypothetical protein